MDLIPIVELGVAEAYTLLAERFGVTGLPPLEAIENEDWGRDYLLTRLFEMPASALAEAGLRREDRDRTPSGGTSAGCDPTDYEREGWD
jgi:hypothetical protein